MKSWCYLTVISFTLVCASGQDAAWWHSRLYEETLQSNAAYEQHVHTQELKARAARGDSAASFELQLFHGKEGAAFVAAVEADRKKRQQIDAQNKRALNPTWRTNEIALVDLVAIKTKALTELHKLERTKGDTNQIEIFRQGIKTIDGRILELQQRKKAIEGQN